MSENANVASLKSAYAKWAACKGADSECWTSIMADDASLGSLAEGAPEMTFTAPRSNKLQIQQYLEELTRDWDMISHEMNEFVSEGDRVVVIGRVTWRNKATQKAVETPKVDIWRFHDGKAVDFQEFYDTARAFAAATPDR